MLRTPYPMTWPLLRNAKCHVAKCFESREKRKCSSGYRNRPVFCAEKVLVDSMAMTPSQQAAGNHARQALVVLSALNANRTRSL